MTTQFYTPDGLAKLLLLPRSTIWKRIREGSFKNSIKVGKHYRIPAESVEEFNRKHKISHES